MIMQDFAQRWQEPLCLKPKAIFLKKITVQASQSQVPGSHWFQLEFIKNVLFFPFEIN